ncbi:14251_t:CDS:1, partial [Funneliformis caledonium]
ESLASGETSNAKERANKSLDTFKRKANSRRWTRKNTAKLNTENMRKA